MGLDAYLNVVLALALVLGLIAAVAWAAKRYGLGGAVRAGGRERRLALVETLPLDAKRRLILVRRDGVEHLLLTGAGADLVIETGIAAPRAPAATESS